MSKKRQISIAALCGLGFLATIELAMIFIKVNFTKGGFKPSFCSISNLIDCDGVAQTTYSVFMGIPLAFWGLMLYSLMLFLLCIPFLQKKFPNSIFKVFKNPRSYIATFGILSFTISMILAFISIFEINKICVLCFATYFLDLIIAFTAKTPKSFFVADIKNTIQDFISGAKEYFVLFIVVLLAFGGFLYYTSTSYIFAPNLKAQMQFQQFRKMKTNPYGVTGNVLGNPKGNVRVFVFGDFLCPHCKMANTMAHKLAKDYNEVIVNHINFPLDVECNPYIGKESVHPHACLLARYAIAAKKQDNYWGFVNLMYDNMPESEARIVELAKKAGFDAEKLVKDKNSTEVNEELALQINFAQNSGIYATPSFSMNDVLYVGVSPYDELLNHAKQAYKRYLRDNK